MAVLERRVRLPQRITFLVLRYMRRPLMTLITVYAVSMVGWILIPGVKPDGSPDQLSFFHAFYFLTYTVTTTGFGELPHTFTEAQRMWGIVSLYAGVIAWFYALGSIVGLVQNPDFQLALEERRFAKRVRRITEPFCIICGFGNTGALLTRGLTDAGVTVIIVERRIERIKTLQLRDYRSSVAGLCADARVPEHLVEAGLTKANCQAIIALTQEEELNLKIAVAARLLSENVQVITQSTSAAHEEILATLGGDVHIIDPFQTYARYLAASIRTPAVHTVNQWLSGTPDATLDQIVRPPTGTWVICGLGRMGGWLIRLLRAEEIETVAIEPNDVEAADIEVIAGRATRDNLIQANVESAAGIVVATQSDTDNLSIVLTTKSLNPDAFIIVRQNRYRNRTLFDVAKTDMVMMPSIVSARRILFLLIAPMLKTFFEHLSDDTPETRDADDIVRILRERVGGSQPRVWTVDTAHLETEALRRFGTKKIPLTLEHVLSDPADRDAQLPSVPLVLERADTQQVLPDLTTTIQPGDRLLLCGTERARRLIDATFNNEYTLFYLATGTEEPRGWLMHWLERRLAQAE